MASRSERTDDDSAADEFRLLLGRAPRVRSARPPEPEPDDLPLSRVDTVLRGKWVKPAQRSKRVASSVVVVKTRAQQYKAPKPRRVSSSSCASSVSSDASAAPAPLPSQSVLPVSSCSSSSSSTSTAVVQGRVSTSKSKDVEATSVRPRGEATHVAIVRRGGGISRWHDSIDALLDGVDAAKKKREFEGRWGS